MGLFLLLGALSVAANSPLISWIDLTADWRFAPDPGGAGREEEWFSPGYADEAWTMLDAGSRWEDQGFPDVDGYAWYRRDIEVPGDWRGKDAWLVLGGVNDACAVWCNGTYVNSYGDEQEVTVCTTPLIASVGKLLRPGERNIVAIRCLDWGSSGGLWRAPCALTCDSARLPLEKVAACHIDFEAKQLTVETDLTGLGNDRAETVVQIDLTPGGAKAIPLKEGAMTASAVFDLDSPAPGTVYTVHVAPKDRQGRQIQHVTACVEVRWPEVLEWAEPYAGLKVRNNFVTELLSAPLGGTPATHSFPNPRTGWVFITTTSPEAPEAVLDGESDALVWRRNPDTGAFEAMRLLSEGEHRITVQKASEGVVEIRTMPEIAFCYYPSGSHIPAYGPYDWAYMNRHILPQVNTLITTGSAAPEEFEQWRREGRQWISNASLPGLNDKEAPSVDSVYEYWATNPGFASPGFSGVMADEFLWASKAHYAAWGDAIRRLRDNAAFADRVFYAWCVDLYEQEASLEFSRKLVDMGYRFSWERYLREEATPSAAEQRLFRELQQPFQAWRKAMPGVERNTVVCLGYLCAPPETVNLDPGVDYHVFMDMQFHLLATDPTFWGLYGVMEYMAAYADEESIRWAHRMFRHYCIEGNRTRLLDRPLALPHLVNPDFADGLEGWRVEAAEPDSVAAGEMDGFSWLEGRYPRTSQGDRFCRMKRSAAAPNFVRQAVKALEPGQVYSVKLISADLGQMSVSQVLALVIGIDNAEILGQYGFQVPYGSCYSHEVGPYTREHPAYFNFHRVVFRATAPTADLTISDWAAPHTPGGLIGQEIAFNFVEVQPFLE
ncbi:MAG: Beta galactosidase jelly roll protein [Candidatus Hydrogenedentes bacterium]|nr:Beta galactosidase jelly roll protein [Candidatus Hydrogenedentota bacterium]